MALLYSTGLYVFDQDVGGCFLLFMTRYRGRRERIGSKGAAHRLSAESVSSARYLTSKQTRCINSAHDGGSDQVGPSVCSTRLGYTAAEQQATTVPS